MPFPRATIPVNPFTINHSQQEVDDMKTLLRLSPLGPDTYENSSIHNHKFGPSKAWMEDMKQSWLEFDWSAAQTKLNEFPQFIADVKDVDPLTGKEDVFKVHFVGIENKDPEAIPVVIMHGWPGNFNEILPLVPYLLTTPNPPMHIIVPSLIGYSYSSPAPLDREFGIEGCARVLNSLMLGLGYDRYVAQGGDLGAFLGRYMAIRFEACHSVHFNFIPERGPSSIIGHLTTPFLSESDKHGLERSEWFVKDGYAYNQEQATRPATIGFTVGSSPVGLLAWVGEKLLHWTDTTPSRTHILTWLSLYWLTRSYPTSIYPYRSPFQKLGLSTHPGPASDTRDLTKELKGAYVEKMMGYSKFPYELIPTPESWAGRTGNMVFFREHDVGGHFAATEQPELLAGDFVQFLKIVWPGAKEKSGSGSGSVGGSSL